MQKKYYILLCFSLVFMTSKAVTTIDHILTFFIRPYPVDTISKEQDETLIKKFTDTVSTPGKITYKVAQNHQLLKQHGIFVTYFGYLVVSDGLGQVTFPRFAQQPTIQLIITEQTKPIMMIGNTVHHWEIIPGNPAAAYTLERKQDAETKLFYWDMQPTALPENNIIPLNAIVVLTKPSAIVVPTGITITTENPQWILPTIYATKAINTVAPALAALTVRQFFGPISLTRKKATDTYYSTQINTHQ